MVCVICEKRKAKRFCPAKSAMICAICCGQEREVTIDCPSDCPHLIASREHYEKRLPSDWDTIPFAERRISRSVLAGHDRLFLDIAYAVCESARENPSLVDSDVIAAMVALAEGFDTLSKGVIYEKPPDHRMQRELYDALKKAVEGNKERDREGLKVPASVPEPEMRDVLILLTQLVAMRSNGRPKGRASIDFLRSQFDPGTFTKNAPGLIVTP